MEHWAEDFIRKEYPGELRTRFYSTIQVALSISNQLLADQRSFFSGNLAPNITGRVVSFAIAKQFTPECFKGSLLSKVRKVNVFGYIVPEIHTNRSVLYLQKSSQPDHFRSAKYIKDAAENNDLAGQQLMMDLIQQQSNPTETPKCILLQYGVKHRELSYCRLVMPDPSLTRSLGDVDLQESAINCTPEEKKYREKQLVELKQDILDQVERFFKIG